MLGLTLEEDLLPDLDLRNEPGTGSSSADAAVTDASLRQLLAPDDAGRHSPSAGTCTQRRRASALLTFLHAPSIFPAAAKRTRLPARSVDRS